MRFTFFAVLAMLACSPGNRPPDAGPEDAGKDAGAEDAGTADAGQDAGPPAYTGCTCGDAGVCGTGQLGDPMRCCNYMEDSCTQDAGPCAALKRCSPRPACCADHSCFSSVSCSGSGACGSWLGGGAPAEGTPCDDGRSCSEASPAVSLPSCAGTDAGVDGDDCRSDNVAAFPSASSCPPAVPSCSGPRSAYSGNGGAIVYGRCCPLGLACDFRVGSATAGKCIGNLGKATATNDVCRAGVCSTDVTTTCP